ncbi:unnamed protein product, partial [Meganyctiphanes norvegica]
ASLPTTQPGMKLMCIVLLGLVSLSWCRPTDILDIDLSNHEHEQEGKAGVAVEGEYSWVHPNGQEFVVKYIADDNGFRVLDSELPAEPEAEEPEEDSAEPAAAVVKSAAVDDSDEEDD